MDDLRYKLLLKLQSFAETLSNYVSTHSDEWSVKGFIDVEKNLYTISSDSKIISKIISKILEIQLFPKFQEFAKENGYQIILVKNKIGILIYHL